MRKVIAVLLAWGLAGPIAVWLVWLMLAPARKRKARRDTWAKTARGSSPDSRS